ncbi:wax ester/triacylglycerol synthase family O-acyltransferase [Dietzia aerolata]|nr:wax ester/triacylglycerol synthase family O-acyltransferase [Dietzia aerolata]
MQRLSGLDASFLYFETRSQLLHVCGLIVLDVSEMPGGYTFDGLRSELARRITGMPSFRRKLHDSMLNVDHPVWVEDEEFDVDNHLHRVALPEPRDDKTLAELTAHLASQPIDRSMPLWQMYVVEGLQGGRVAVFAKMHHSTVDGVTGANMMSQLCTLTPDDPTLDEELVKETAGGSGALELAVGGALSRLATPWRLASLLPGTLGVLPSWISRARKGLAMPAPFTAPRTPFNGTITGHRTLSFTSVELEDIKRVKNAFGTTVNDVVLAVCSTALRKYLDGLDALPTKPLIAMVPMSVHAEESRPGTNRVSGMFMSLSTDIDDPVERLEAIRDANIVAKDHTNGLDANLLTDWAQFTAPSVFGSAVRMYSRLRLSERHPVVHNLVISNVPGPNIPLYFLGGRIERMLPLGPVFHGAGLNATVMSMDGKLHFGFIACKRSVPDPWPLADAVDEALAEYVEAAAERDRSGAPAVVRKTASELAAERRAQRKAAKLTAKESGKSAGSGEKSAAKAPAKKAPAKKAPAKKAPAKKAPAKKAPARKAVPAASTETVTESSSTATPAKAPAKKAPAKKAAASKTPANKAPAKKTAAQKAPAKKAAAKKPAAATAPAKKAPAKKATTAASTAQKPVASKPVASKPASDTRPAATKPAPAAASASAPTSTDAASKPTGSKPTGVAPSASSPATAAGTSSTTAPRPESRDETGSTPDTGQA